MDKKLIEKHLEEIIVDDAFFVVEVDFKKGNVINISIDADHGVKISDCIKISRELEQRLDRDTEDFELHVSSAGFTRHFTVFRQYKKNIGRALDVMTRSKEHYTGLLLSATEGEGIELELKDFSSKKPKKSKEAKIISVKFEDITLAKGIVTF